MTEQFRNPFRVFDIGFVPRNLLDLLRVGDDDLQLVSFQNGVHRLPIDARALHGHMGTALWISHSRSCSNSRVVVPKVRNCFCTLPSWPNHQQTGHHRCLVHVESTTAFYQRLHNASFQGGCCAAGLLQKLPCVLPACGYDPLAGTTKRDTFTGAGQPVERDLGLTVTPDLQAIARKACTTGSPVC